MSVSAPNDREKLITPRIVLRSQTVVGPESDGKNGLVERQGSNRSMASPSGSSANGGIGDSITARTGGIHYSDNNDHAISASNFTPTGHSPGPPTFRTWEWAY